MNFQKMFNFLFVVTMIFYSNLSLAQSTLDQSFLEGLPQSIRDQVEVENKLDKEEELNKLFRSETSIEKNKVILDRLKAEILALDKKFSDIESLDAGETLPRFGVNFFRTLQSSFMPVNVPNLGSDYVVDIGDTFEILLNTLAQSLMVVVKNF